jgi:hypothetical protein
MMTRNSNYIHTRSGKRYPRHTQDTQPTKRRRVQTTTDGENETTQNEVTFHTPKHKATITIYHPNEEVGVKVINFEDWEGEVKKTLQETLQMTQEELESYPFLEWFLNGTETSTILDYIRRDFFRDEYVLYLEPFHSWQREVDNLLFQNLGMRRLDLPDFPFYDHFHNMETPMEMVNHIKDELYF